MTESTTGSTVLSPELFADGPARDDRFDVKERWIECNNLPRDHPEKDVEFLHRQMNEEIDGLECSARCLSDFPDADWTTRMSMARQCSDEARHVQMFRRLLESRGGKVGDYPVLNFQYRIITNIDNLVGRLAVQNRSFEAEGIDAISYGIKEARARGDEQMAELYEAQLADEIEHVRYANEHVRAVARTDPRSLFRVAAALAKASKAFAEVMGTEATGEIPYPIAPDVRLEAGFLQGEIDAVIEGVAATRPRPPAPTSHNP